MRSYHRHDETSTRLVGKFVQTRRNCRQLVANSVHTADSTQLDSCIASAVCIGLKRNVLNSVFDWPALYVAVESPCHPGCTGLRYCSNLNERPTEMFRACNSLADDAARRTVQLWQSGTISVPRPFTFHIPIKGRMLLFTTTTTTTTTTTYWLGLSWACLLMSGGR